MRKILVVFCFALVLTLALASASINVTLQTSLSGVYSDFRLYSNPLSSNGMDGFDVTKPSLVNNYTQIYSTVSGNYLSFDSWPASASRTINLTFYSSSVTGNLNITWDVLGSDFDVYLIDYGTNSYYNESVSSTLDLSTENSYEVSSGTSRYIQLILTYNPGQSINNQNTGSSGGGGSSGGAGIIQPLCTEELMCTEWTVCQNLKVTYNESLISGDDFNLLSSECIGAGFLGDICGFQIRSCLINSNCNITLKDLPKQVSACHYTDNPNCFDGIKNCHDGRCEVLVDCGGACGACPTCSDGIKNQKEKNIDCGGPCPSVCKSKFTFPTKLSLDKIGDTLYIVLNLVLLVVILLLIVKLFKEYNSNKQTGDLRWDSLSKNSI